MFGLFKPKPPLSPWEKAWAENRMGWMAGHFGMNCLLDAPTLISDYAGIPNVSNKEEATELLTFIKQWMKLDFNAHLQVFSDTPTLEANVADAAEDSLRIEIHEKHFDDRDVLIAIIARQLAQRALVGTVIQNEGWAIDLHPAFCGLGIFAANATLRATGRSDGLSWWTTQQSGYLPSRIFGYALALRHTVRGDASAEWSSVMRQDALVAFQEGVTYLEKTKDTVFNRDLLTKPREGVSDEALLDELRTGSPSLKIAAMWAFNTRTTAEPVENPKLVDLIKDCLRHKEPEVRAVAASSLPRYDLTASAATDIADALKDRSDKVRISAAAAMEAYPGVDDEFLVTELTDSLKDDVRLVVFNAAQSLTAYGKAAEPASKMLLQRLRRSLNECRDDDCRTILWAINAIVSDPVATLEEFFGEQDAEYLVFSKELLEEVNQTV